MVEFRARDLRFTAEETARLLAQMLYREIDETTAAGPAAFNDGMPPYGPSPTRQERYQLGEWIACGMPE